MRIYISADIEGVTDVTVWDETKDGGSGYEAARTQMTAEVAAACRGAFAGGADEVVVKDAHGGALNLNHGGLPRGVQLIRSWCASIDSMMAGVDRGFDGVFFTGYHSEGGSNANPLAHTTTWSNVYQTKINGSLVSEMEINAMISGRYGVPVALVTGDKAICEKAEKFIPGVVTAPVKEGIGRATWNIHPADACDKIEAAAKAAAENLKSGALKPVEVPEKPVLEITYRQHFDAKNALCYPGTELVDPHTVRYAARDFEDLQTAYNFMLP